MKSNFYCVCRPDLMAKIRRPGYYQKNITSPGFLGYPLLEKFYDFFNKKQAAVCMCKFLTFIFIEDNISDEFDGWN